MLRVGVIGTGAWGINHVRAISDSARTELIAIADPDPAARTRCTQIAPTVRCHADPDAVLAADVDAIVLSSPAPTHAALAQRALAAGKHVLIEKPLALSVADALAIRDAARAARKTAMVGHLMLYHPAVLKLRELLHSGALGAFRYLHATRVNLGRLRRDENALWSFGPHDLAILDFLLGHAPISVSARGQCMLQPGIEDVVFMTARFADGSMASLNLSWLSPRKERRVTLVCSQKMAELDDVAKEKLRIYDKGYDRPPEFTEYAQYLTLRDGDVYVPTIEMREPLALQLDHFVDCIATGAEPRSSLDSGIRVTTVLAAASASMAADGAPVPVLTPV